MPKALAWFITFNFVNIAWVFFRAKSWENALNVLKGMFGLNGLTLPETIIQKLKFLETIGIGASVPLMSFTLAIPAIFMAVILAILFMNSNEMQAKFEPTRRFMIMTGLVFIISVLHMSKYSEFVYFRF